MMFRPALTALLLTAATLPAAEVSDADKRIVQTVQRLSSFDYAKANPKTQIGRASCRERVSSPV